MERLPNVHQLPRGRHRLTREQVLSSQRGRMLEAIALAVADRGYPSTPVSEVIRRAGVSRETFYEHFSDKEDCFLAALETGAQAMLATLGDALGDPSGSPLERFDRAIRAYLDALASEPTFARVFLIETYAAGPRALERRMDIQQRFVDAVAGIFAARSTADRFACEALVAAISMMVTTRVAAGRAADLRKLRRPLIALVREAAPQLAQRGQATA